ncbi:NrsF family protein [Bradyrhizobium genosp. P]|uniref:NrsF family protein n=1 Tax=Bradyrhizobium genosp. P TaxID=83641 RepID=UPI003CE7F213
MKTEMLIGALVQDSSADWDFDRTVWVAMTSGSLIAGVIFFVGVGFRPDIAYATETIRFLFKFVVTVPLAIAAMAAMERAGRPGSSFGLPGWALGILPLILGCAVLVELIMVPESLWTSRLVGSNARVCLTLIPLLAMGPLACFLVALRRGAPTRPGLAGALAGLAASGIAATFYATNCIDDSPLFVATWYPIATSMVVATGYLAGCQLLKW